LSWRPTWTLEDLTGLIVKVEIKDICTYCGLCLEICPGIFEKGWDKVEVIVDRIPPEFEEGVQQTSDECPPQAIIVE